MKRVLTVLAIFMSMLFSGAILVSCSNDTKKMTLVVEYALPTADGKDVEWKEIEADGSFDYTLSDNVYVENDSSYVLYLRVKVKGTSKKVKSLYISQSANNSTILENNTVKPDEAFKVLIKNIGSVSFKITPSSGGDDKSVEFAVNIYRELTEIKQSADCVPALVTGGYIKLEDLNNLIQYYPLSETNQTGVDYTLEAVGTLVHNGESGLIGRPFVASEDYVVENGVIIKNRNETEQYVQLDNSTNDLMLKVSEQYNLTGGNNVIKLKATSKYNPEISTYVYVYIVENFNATSLLVSYSDSVSLDGSGNLPTQADVSKPVGDRVTIYNSAINNTANSAYNAISMYTYTNASIYSYESNPGMKLTVYVNGVEYDYNSVVNNNIGIQISPATKLVNGEDKLIGLKFEVNPNANSSINEYDLRLELDFTAFNFSASDKTPVSVLNKEFVVKVESLASGFHINGKGYGDNIEELNNGIDTNITEYSSTQSAKLYTSYSQTAIGMPLNIQATPTNAIDTNVYVSFYEDYTVDGYGKLSLGTSLMNKVQLLESQHYGLNQNNGEFVINFANKNKLVYLKFNDGENISGLTYIYMVCRAVCTPATFGLNAVKTDYITFVAKIDVVGAVDNIYVYRNADDNVSNNTLNDTYLANNEINIAYINLITSSQSIDLTQIKITSANNNIKYSADNANWFKSITADQLKTVAGGTYKILYFRTIRECADSLIIASPNGIGTQIEYQFVNVTSSTENVSVNFDNTYIWQSLTVDTVEITDVANNVDLNYLALQAGRTVQFEAKGDGRNANIKGVTAKSLLVSSSEYGKITMGGTSLYATAISTFSASAIRVVNTGNYLFDVRANSVGFTSIMLVKVDFYVRALNADGVAGSVDDNVYTIVERSKYFLYEVAVYTPAKDLAVTTDKDTIVYVNDYYPSSARVEFSVGLNAATTRIQFSSTTVNESINLTYGSEGTSLYGISVTASDNMLTTDSSGNSYFNIVGLNNYKYEMDGKTIAEDFINNETKRFSIQAVQALKDLQEKGQTSIWVDITIYQFGEETIHQIRKVIYLGNYEKTERIIVDGVDNYNNIYLSLLKEGASKTTIYASISNKEATYQDIGFNLFQVAENSNGLISYEGDNLKIVHNQDADSFEIIASTKGGIYQLELYAKDSYDSKLGDYSVKFSIRITVSDGQTEATAYLIASLSDFEAIANTSASLASYYRLAKDIDISALNTNNWWNKDRGFKGFLDGAITINDPNSGKTIYKCYSLIGLKISQYKAINDANCFGLFTSVTGTIQNVIFDKVEFDIELDGDNTANGTPVNIGAITAVNNGKIINCSVNIVISKIIFKSDDKNTTKDESASTSTYNIGLIAGVNNNIISYNNTNIGSNYAYMTDVYNAGKLTIAVQSGNTKLNENAYINIGGVTGSNAGNISATYQDGSDQAVRTLITAVVNIKLEVGYDASNAPMLVNNNLGGIAGVNSGTITNVAISGSLKANDKVNIGGIAGFNTGAVKDSANYGAYICGEVLIDEYAYSYTDGKTRTNVYYGYSDAETTVNLEQNIGGIIGANNAGTVDNVRVMFILFDSNEVSVASVISGLEGVGNLGGVIGKATNTQLTRAYVENFVADSETELNYNIIGSKANIAGLIASSTGSSAVLSFVQADFNVGASNFYEFGNGLTYHYVYFIGDVLSDNITTDRELYLAHNGATATSYIINNVVYMQDGAIAKNIVKYGESDIQTNINGSVSGYDYVIQWRKSTTINGEYPYLVYIVENNPVYTLTIRPTDIIVNVDEDYFEKTEEDITTRFERYDTTEGATQDGLYIQYVDNNETPDDDTDDKAVATAVVYYVKNGNNTHQLVSDDSKKGLIEKAIIPLIATDTYSVSIISGAQIASLTDADKTITFYGTGKVELRFVSIYDRNIQDTVVIFVENPLNSDTFEVTTGAGLEDRTALGQSFATSVGTNSILTLSLKDVNGQMFDSTKTYMKASIGTVTTNISGAVTNIADSVLKNYFLFEPITAVSGNGYSLGQFKVSALGLEPTYSYIQVPITLRVYLNLDKYSIDDIALSTLMGGAEALLEEKEIIITIYNKATGLSVSSDVQAEAGVSVDIKAELITGYVNPSSVNGHIAYTIVGEKGDRLLLNISGQDKINVVLSAVNDNAKDLLTIAKDNAENPAEFSVWDLFDVNISCQLLNNNSGYAYVINLRLKEEYRYLDANNYDEREWKFGVAIIANSNNELSKTVEVSFVPQQLSSFRLENYSNLVSKAGATAGSAESTFVSSEVESSLIIPGESGLIKVFAEYSYSYFENISISSTTQVIDGVTYFVRFQQMVYNKTKDVYESYAGITADGESLTLKKVSYSDGSYNGVIFVRTILDNIVGVRRTFTITVNATTYDENGNSVQISRAKTVISQYRPGVYVSVTNAIADTYDNSQIYLVEKNSSVTNIVARVYGYEFNIQPKISIKYLDDNSSVVNVEVVLIQQGDIEYDNTGAYVITYALGVYTNRPFKVSIEMELLDNGNTLTSDTKHIIFYPAPYVINDVYLRGEANGGLSVAINSSRNMELVWSTKSTTNAKVEQINSAIKDLDFLKLFYIVATDASGRDYNKYFNTYLDATDTNFSVKQNKDGTYRIEALMQTNSNINVHFNLWYRYIIDSDGVSIEFSTENEKGGVRYPNLVAHEFDLHLTMDTTEDAPEPIATQADLMAMSANQNYILVNDITLENWMPLNTAIASLDGNGKVINIKSFNIAVTSSMSVGLFDTIAEDTIIKNVVINIGTMENNLGTNQTALYIKDENVASATVNFGILAGINKGLIYNCEVLSINSSRAIELVVGANYNLTFGGLVGVNQGNITNSRVGTEYFEQLTVSNLNVSSAVIKCGALSFKSSGVMAGLVGQNDTNCIISACYVANTSIENKSNSTNSKFNRTAGFVATNSGLVVYSYVKGTESSILVTKSRATGAKIYSSGDGCVAGFAYINSGEIHDCYSNIICESSSSGVAGFVYDTTNGRVVQCYSASTVISGSTNTALATELPFVGVGVEKDNAKKLLSNAEMINCYYLDDGTTEYDTNYDLSNGAVEPKELDLTGFANPSSLNNYSFISNGATEQQLNGVWTYSTAVDKNKSTYGLGVTSLPELTSANTISRSIRVYNEQQSNGVYSYTYPVGYELGSSKNPYIIRSADEYKTIFVDSAPTTSGTKYKTGYVRFIDNISFSADGEYTNIDTRSNYILGDKTNHTLTLLDGNGMTISDVVINYANEDAGELGLFSEVYYTVIKGLNIEYSSQDNGDGSEVGSSTVTYAGGVAGIAKDTYLIDIDLSGGVTLRAHNVVGGVVGRLTGANSGLYNITTDLNVQAGNYSNSIRYSGERTGARYLSYAGGIAGIIDIGNATNVDGNFNINKLSVSSSNVRANRAGGIAGYMGSNVNAKRLTYIISSASQVLGREVAGGIVADNFADIQLSQANRNIDEQYDYDKAFAQYINNENVIELDKSENSIYGNLSAVTGEQIVGGFIGINYAGKIQNSLTKANIGYNDDYGVANTIGGFIGKTYGGNLKYVYAQNYIDLSCTLGSINDYASYVGGLVGHIANEASDGLNIEGKSTKFGLDNVVLANWFDKSQVNNIATYEPKQMVDYLAGKMDSGVKVCKDSESDGEPIVNYGVFNADDEDLSIYEDGKIKNTYITSAQYYSMNDLYYTNTAGDNSGSSTQADIFMTLFGVWAYDIWDLDYTKFMPNLKEDNTTNYRIIDEKDDLLLLEQFPDDNFLLIEDVNVGEWENYVVNTNFKGILIGTLKEDGTYTRFYNITLNAKTTNSLGAGFFKQTTGARISNINFSYNSITLNGSNYVQVGGISATDNGSKFEQINVTQASEGYAIKTTGSATVSNLGSIVGDSQRSSITSCESNLTYNVKSNHGNIGGLVGKLNGYYYDEEEELVRWDGLVSASVYSGKILVNSDNGANVGGIVGYAEYSRISGSKVMISSTNIVDGKEITDIENVAIAMASKNANYVGGIAAIADMTSVSDCSAEIEVVDTEDVAVLADDTISSTYYIGGIVGEIVNQSAMDKDVEDSYARLTFNLIGADNVYLGGIVGDIATDSGIKLNRVVSELTIVNRTTATSGMVDVVDNMIVGGIVAINSAKEATAVYGVTVDNSVAIMNADVAYNTSMIGGGIIGQSTGSYTINYSTSIGQIFANNEKDKHVSPTSTSLTILGGLVGLADEISNCIPKETIIKQEINNSYTVLTLSTAGVYKGDVTDIKDVTKNYSHDVYTNAVVGYTCASNTITGGGVLYSSDYNLTFDSNRVFENNPQNVTSNILIFNAQTLTAGSSISISAGAEDIRGYIGEGWFLIDEHLPTPTAVKSLLIKMDILQNVEGSIDVKFNEYNIGAAYSPIIINSQDDLDKIDNHKYKYYLIANDLTTDNTVNLNGVMLGNNAVIKSKVELLGEIAKHSAVSNLTFMLQDGFSGVGVVANTNNGTVFMVGVQYDNNVTINDKFGGIVSINNGFISNCYNMGNATNASANVGGLVHTNSVNASIEDSYFTGSFNGGESGSALVGNNSGYLANSYSAGMASNFIAINNEDSRCENLLFDYYANYITIEDYNTYLANGIIGKSTREMQAVILDKDEKTVDSATLEGWKVYSMYNWDEITRKDVTISTTYNYGYPIHNFEQLTYNDSTIAQIPIRVKRTGNGSFNRFEDENGNVIINETDVKTDALGKVVSTVDNGNIEYYDNCSFLINNMGVLHLINNLDDTTKYFELEVDIILPESVTGYMESSETNYQLLSNWSGIGLEAKPFTGVFNTTTAIGESESQYVLDRTLLDQEMDDNGINFNNTAKIVANDTRKLIQNITGNALFNYVENGAVIANVTLQGSRINTAPLINGVGVDGYDARSLFAPTIFNTSINESIKTNTAGSISGLVYTVNTDKTLNLHSVNIENLEIIAYNEEANIVASAVAGAINENNGTINIQNSFKSTILTFSGATNTKISGFVNKNGKVDNVDDLGTINIVDAVTITLNSNEDNLSGINGFVAENAGKILTINDNSIIKIGELGKVTTAISGLVGVMNSGVIGGFDITFELTEGDSYQADIFGGVASYLYGGQLGVRPAKESSQAEDTDAVERPIIVNLSTATANIFGGVVAIGGSSNGEQLTTAGGIVNVKIKTGEQIAVKSSSIGESNAYGLVIGKYVQALSEIYYTIEQEISFKVNNGTNVGAVIGLATANTFNFTNEKPSLVKVYGFNNVGGFIGQYIAETSLIMKGNTWVVSSEAEGDEVSTVNAEDTDNGYAQVEIFVPTATSTGAETKQSSNFGGLIGYWNSTAELRCFKSNEDGDNDPLEIINENIVLSMTDIATQPEINWFRNVEHGTGYDYTITNIGGVVGKSNASILNAKNKATVGVELKMEKNPHGGKNPIYGVNLEDINLSSTINQFMQFIYVGGVAGFIQNENAVITDCLSIEGNVYGMYAVGGMVGGSTGSITITITEDIEQDIISEMIVIGLADVGGLVGKVGSLVLNASTEEQAKITFGQIIGVTNVGGVVGYATSVDISNCVVAGDDEETKISIMGNLNVGGIVGYATSGNIENCSVQMTKVIGTVFDYVYDIWNEDLQADEPKAFYYMPTNVGGVAGYIAGNSDFEEVEAGADVKTDLSYKVDDKGGIYTISMYKNYVGIIDDIASKTNINTQTAEARIKYLEGYYNTILIDYDAVDGGIGGFAGRLDNPNFVESNSDAETGGVLVESKVTGSVYAIYGVNVGGIIGFLNHDQAIALAQLPTELDADGNGSINVAGNLFVGGYIGKCNGLTSNTVGFFDLNPIAYVDVQQYNDLDEIYDHIDEDKVLGGSCIGGVIGYSTGQVNNVKILYEGSEKNPISKIKVFNSNNTNIQSVYVGAIVGRIDASMTNCEISVEFCDAVESKSVVGMVKEDAYAFDYRTVEGIIQTPATYNYGGLVGLADVPLNSIGDNAFNVLGKHYYAFTVDMVQNRDYVQGQSIYTYEEEALIANAHYINMSDINISASALDGLYNIDAEGSKYDDSTTSTLYDHNPINQNARGWAKEYTMFRMFARIVEQEGERVGDSVQVVYNAGYITEVSQIQNGTKDPEILYTIYQPTGQTARLYCKYGIAEEVEGFDPEETIERDALKGNDVAYEKHYAVTTDYMYENEVDGSDDKDRSGYWMHIDDTAMLGAPEGEGAKDGIISADGTTLTNTFITDADKLAKQYNYTFGYSYYLTNGFKMHADYGTNNYLNRKEETYFIFTSVFGYKEINDKGDVIFAEDKTLYSNSGSMFEVTGTVVPITPEASEVGKINKWLNKHPIFRAAVNLATGMAFAMAAGSLGGVVGFVVGMVAGADLFKTVYSVIASLLMAGPTLLATQTYNKGVMMAEANYSTIEGTSMGYLHSAYVRNISWQKDELNPYLDACVIMQIDNVELFVSGGTSTLKGNINALGDDYYEVLANNIIRFDGSGNYKCILPLTYFKSGSSMYMPSDVYDNIVVNVADMADGDMKTLFEKLKIASYTIPKYQSIDNELYIYGGDNIETDRLLYMNYADVYENLSNMAGFDESCLREDNGYGYLLIGSDSGDQSWIISEAEESNLSEYNIKRTINAYIKHSIKESATNLADSDPLKVDLSKLRWIGSVGTGDTSKVLTRNVTFKYSGTDAPMDESYYITRNAIIDDGVTYYKNESNIYVSVVNGSTYSGLLTEPNATAYFTYGGSSSITLNVYLTPTTGSAGLTADELGVSGNYMYARDNNGYINIVREFGLCKHTKFGSFSELTPGYIYNRYPIMVSDDTEIPLYKVITNKEDNELNFELVDANDAASVFENVTVGYLRERLQGEYAEVWKNYSTSNTSYVKVGDVYEVVGGKLCLKSIDTDYLVDENGYIYTPIYGGSEKDVSYVGRYVYNYDVTDSLTNEVKTLKFYTRYKYDGSYVDQDGNWGAVKFLDGEISYKTTNSKGEETTASQSISQILLPENINVNTGSQVLFAESIRVTLSASNHMVYIKATQPEEVTADKPVVRDYIKVNKFGTISCNSDYLG